MTDNTHINEDEVTLRAMGSSFADVAAPARRSRGAEGLTESGKKLLIQRLAIKLADSLPQGDQYDLIRKTLKTQMDVAVSEGNEAKMVKVTKSVWNELAKLKIKVDLARFLNEAIGENDPQKIKAALEDIRQITLELHADEDNASIS